VIFIFILESTNISTPESTNSTFIKDYQDILIKNILSNPEKRETISNVQTHIENISNTINIEDYTDKWLPFLRKNKDPEQHLQNMKTYHSHQEMDTKLEKVIYL
jgi:hypothetical protein